jgi:hypothetical protein
MMNKELKVHHTDLKDVKPKPINQDWAKECYMNLNIKQKFKATRGNLMNPLDLAKSNRADN